VLLQLAHLKSYEHMGQARIACDSGCSCNVTVLDGHQEPRNSQTFLHSVFVSQAPECVVSITVLPDTGSGEHRCKLIGVMVSEVAGDTVGMERAGLLEYISEIASRTGKDGNTDGNFDMSKHV
jgi:hypothetical protein